MSDLPVLIIGAGPTGLALAAQLDAFGVSVRIVDRALDRAHESRALAVQARTLELFQQIGCADALVARGNQSARLALHFGRQSAAISLGGFAANDTRFPFILFVSQAETEAVLDAHLASAGVEVERGTELTDLSLGPDGNMATLRHRDGRTETIRATYVVGCDGAHSTVRKHAGISFAGDAYLQNFMLGDVEADAEPWVRFDPRSLHSFGERGSMAMFFPLGKPATWRVIAMSSADARSRRRGGDVEIATPPLALEELQATVGAATNDAVHLRDPAWLSRFRLHHRQATSYRQGNAFLAGDAAHIHSPVGGQGMNIGIQDAWNLGWKLALVVRGLANPRILDSYQAERYPVGAFLLRYTDRAFGIFTRSLADNAAVAWIRRAIVARVLPRVFGIRRLRNAAFRFIAEFDIDYRESDLSVEGKPALHAGPRAGDRLGDATVTFNGESVTLQRHVIGPHFAILLCGPANDWTTDVAARFSTRPCVAVHRLSADSAPNVLHDADGRALAMLGVNDSAQYVIRPDGHVGFRCAGTDVTALAAYLDDLLRTGAAS